MSMSVQSTMEGACIAVLILTEAIIVIAVQDIVLITLTVVAASVSASF